MNKSAAHTKPADIREAIRSSASAVERRSCFGAHVCVQREANDHGVHPHAASLVRTVLNSPGEPLDAVTRALVEPRLGYDFSGVRVHRDDRAAESARAVNATAYTAGRHVVFGTDMFAPGTLRGRRLMAHELAHVVQQDAGVVAGTPVAPGLSVSSPDDPFERGARAAATDSFVSRTDMWPGQSRIRETSDNQSRMKQSRRLQCLPMNHLGGGMTFVQRQDQPNVGLANAGAVLGIIGGVAGVLGLGLAAFAYFRPPEALNPAPVTGGISINPNPFSFNTLQPTPVPEPPSNRPRFAQAQREAPALRKILDLRTDSENHADLNLALRSDGYNILAASVQPGAMQNYLGGSRGSSATVNFAQTQISPASPIFSAPEPTPGPAGLAATSAASQPSATSTATQAQTVPSQQSPATGQASTPAAGQPTSERAEVMVSFTGTNGKDQKPPQNFAGDISVKADGTVICTRCETTNGLGSAKVDGDFARVDYRAESASASTGSLVSPGSESSGGILPRFDVPNPPLLDRPGAIPE